MALCVKLDQSVARGVPGGDFVLSMEIFVRLFNEDTIIS